MMPTEMDDDGGGLKDPGLFFVFIVMVALKAALISVPQCIWAV